MLIKGIKARCFLALAGYKRRFVKDFSNITIPLTNLLKKMTKFEMLDKCEDTFQELKRRLTISLVLTLLVEGKENTLYSYASKNVLGCMLMQDDKIMTYASKKLKLYEKNYPAHDMQLAAIVFGFKIW